MIVKEGDIVLAPFRFSESEERKLRPCLVIEVMAGVGVKIAMVTSQKLVAAFETETVLSLQESIKLGLKKQSKIDFMKTDRIPLADIRKTLGNLSSLPRAAMLRCYRAMEAAGLFD